MELHTVFFLVIWQFSREKYRRNEVRIVFGVHFPFVNHQFFICFLQTELAINDGIIDERYSDGHIPSVN